MSYRGAFASKIRVRVCQINSSQNCDHARWGGDHWDKSDQSKLFKLNSSFCLQTFSPDHQKFDKNRKILG